MEAKIQKWGNSLGIRIPMNMIRDLALENGSTVDIEEIEDIQSFISDVIGFAFKTHKNISQEVIKSINFEWLPKYLKRFPTFSRTLSPTSSQDLRVGAPANA